MSVISMYMCNHAQDALSEMKLDLELLAWDKISFHAGQKKPLMKRFQVQRFVRRDHECFKLNILARGDFGIHS